MNAPEEKKVFVQLRLDPAEAEELRLTGRAEGRTLPAEIMHRARMGGGEYGLDRATGDLAALIASGAGRALGYPHNPESRAVFLTIIKTALVQVLEHLGAKATLSEHEQAVAFSLVWPAIVRMRTDAMSGVHLAPDEQLLMRIGKLLWEVENKGTDNEQ
jgi:hypothetical protein